MVNCCLKSIVVFHDALYGFTEGRGERTATLESKMAHQLARILHDPLLQVVLEFCKAYDSLERYWCLELLRGYRLGPDLAQPLDNYWKQQRIVPKSGKCLGTPFGTGRGVTQGDTAYPIIYNIVVDEVV